MKTLTSIFITVVVLLFSESEAFSQSDAMNYSDCVEKYRSGWGEDCSQCVNYNDSYVVYLKNTCDQAIDVMVCVQEETKDWKRFQHTSMASGDSLRAYACIGTGKYLAWARRAGDESVIFPSIEQVNADY